MSKYTRIERPDLGPGRFDLVRPRAAKAYKDFEKDANHLGKDAEHAVSLGRAADYQVSYHGSLCLVRPLTLSCQAWLSEHTEEEGENMAQWFGGALCVEPRYLADLEQGLSEEGFVRLGHGGH